MPPIYSKEWKKAVVNMRGSIRQNRTSPCEITCPAGNNIQRMHSLLAEGRVDEALLSLHAKNPFPGITGRVCPHPCEGKCNRCGYDEAVAIHSLERYAADNGHAPRLRPLPDSGKRVAVIGAGPAGLTAACFARLLGHEVSVYEGSAVMGGLMRHSIPDFRLPKDVVDRETGAVADLGVRVHTNVQVGRDISLQDLLDSHDACVLAVGLWKERLLDIPGKEHLQPAVSWMKRSTLERRSLEGQEVVILGGGGVAFDCAFTACRLGAASVRMVCLEAEGAMHAPEAEVLQARDEGISIANSMQTTAVTCSADGMFQVTARPISSFSFDAAGELHTEVAAGAEATFAAHLVICASGLQADLTALAGLDVALTPRGCVAVDAAGMTSIRGLFAAGDVATGPGLVSSAIGSGRNVALGLHAYLAGLPAGSNIDAWFEDDGSMALAVRPALDAAHVVELEEIMHVDYHPHAPRAVVPASEARPRLAFAELEGGLPDKAARSEAGRCLHCGHCISCGSCVESCPGHILTMTEDGPAVAYPEQCWHCGCCRIACSTGSVAYRFPLTMML